MPLHTTEHLGGAPPCSDSHQATKVMQEGHVCLQRCDHTANPLPLARDAVDSDEVVLHSSSSAVVHGSWCATPTPWALTGGTATVLFQSGSSLGTAPKLPNNAANTQLPPPKHAPHSYMLARPMRASCCTTQLKTPGHMAGTMPHPTHPPASTAVTVHHAHGQAAGSR